jgi:phosphopantothenate-cysteine ligase
MHKIQSAKGPLSLSFHLVPKLLRPLVRHWCPRAFVISFKVLLHTLSPNDSSIFAFVLQLETDESILLEKAQHALRKYGHRLVIANILSTRKQRVLLVQESQQEEITISDADDLEIESKIVENVVMKHEDFISSCTHSDPRSLPSLP